MDFLDTIGDTVKGVTDTVADTITDVRDLLTPEVMRDPPNDQYNAAQKQFGTAGEGGYTSYNLPKMKYSFVVEFVLSSHAKEFLQKTLPPDVSRPFSVYDCSCVIVSTDLPNASFNVEVANQYNRPRLIPGKAEYKPVTMTFYDTVDSAVLILLSAYKKYYYGDFQVKSNLMWANDVVSAPNIYDLRSSEWGRILSKQGDFDDAYFFKAINIYEVDGEKYTVHNMYNPLITDITTSSKSYESDDPSTIQFTINYEGIGNIGPITDAIAAPSTEIANKLVSADMFGKSGFFTMYGKLDDPNVNVITGSKVLQSVVSGIDVVNDFKDILNGDFTVDTIRNLGNAIQKGTDTISAIGDTIRDTSSKLGLGNIFGD